MENQSLVNQQEFVTVKTTIEHVVIDEYVKSRNSNLSQYHNHSKSMMHTEEKSTSSFARYTQEVDQMSTLSPNGGSSKKKVVVTRYSKLSDVI